MPKLQTEEYVVLVGRNNCGKSFLLKTLKQRYGVGSFYLGPARYQNFSLLTFYLPGQTSKENKHQEFMSQFNQEQQNIDNSPVNLQQSISELSDVQRGYFVEIMKHLLDVDIGIESTDPLNSMSQKYISCSGHNLSYTSSGLRLVATLVASLLDRNYDTFLIDEPELGISPEAQGALADFLFDRERRKKYFPHIKTLMIATHSTIFLDRVVIRNNYIVSKLGDVINVHQTETQADFSKIHFFLLGNRFETLYLPSAIILVEGKTDFGFIEAVFKIKFPNLLISVIAANSDSRIKEVLNTARGLFSDFQKSPYRDRTFVVLDSVHTASLPGELERMGLPKSNIIIWDKNGIEYYYPPQVVDKIFGPGPDVVISGDAVSRNGNTYTKNQLSADVCRRLTYDSQMDQSFQEKFIDIVMSSISK